MKDITLHDLSKETLIEMITAFTNRPDTKTIAALHINYLFKQQIIIKDLLTDIREKLERSKSEKTAAKLHKESRPLVAKYKRYDSAIQRLHKKYFKGDE